MEIGFDLLEETFKCSRRCFSELQSVDQSCKRIYIRVGILKGRPLTLRSVINRLLMGLPLHHRYPHNIPVVVKSREQDLCQSGIGPTRSLLPLWSRGEWLAPGLHVSLIISSSIDNVLHF